MIIEHDEIDHVTAAAFAAATGWDPEAGGPVPRRGVRAGPRLAP